MIRFLHLPLAAARRIIKRGVNALLSAHKPARLAILIVIALILPLSCLYAMIEPMSLAQELGASLRGGASNLPDSRTACIPESAVIDSGRYTSTAQKIIAHIPPNTPAAPASAYLLYRFSHLDDAWQPTWPQWIGYLGEHDITDTASDVDIALSVDPSTDYRTYLIPARATIIDLSVNGPVVADKKQLSELADQIYRNCTTTTPSERSDR